MNPLDSPLTSLPSARPASPPLFASPFRLPSAAPRVDALARRIDFGAPTRTTRRIVDFRAAAGETAASCSLGSVLSAPTEATSLRADRSLFGIGALTPLQPPRLPSTTRLTAKEQTTPRSIGPILPAATEAAPHQPVGPELFAAVVRPRSPLPAAAAGSAERTPPHSLKAAERARQRVLEQSQELKAVKRPRMTLPAHVVRSHDYLEKSYIIHNGAHIFFSQEAQGHFQTFARIHEGQPELIVGRDNATLGLKFFHTELRRVDYSHMHQRILNQHARLLELKIPCPTIHNAENYHSGCGFLIVDYVPYEAGPLNPFEVAPIFEIAYANRICLDLRYDNLRRMTPESGLTLIDWGGEDDELEAPSTALLNIEFKKMFKHLEANCPDLATAIRASATLSHLADY